MSNWNQKRSELKEALYNQREMLESLKKRGFAETDREVKSCQRNIRDLERDLKQNFSYSPAV